MSNEYIGEGSVRRLATPVGGRDGGQEAIGGLKKLGLDSPLQPRPPLSARGRAGQVLVEEVMLGVLDSVSLFHFDYYVWCFS